jgi:hypothetical protein
MTDQAKTIYSIYLEISECFHLDMIPCAELESPGPSGDREARVEQWLRMADDQIEVTHVREFLSQSRLSEEGLHALLARHLGKEPKDRRDRDKIDFLLVQYLAERLPVNAPAHKLSFAQAAEVLKPVLGENNTPKRVPGLEDCIQDLDRCLTLCDFVDRWILERGHAVKVAVHQKPFDATTLVAFARFSFLMRLGAIRVLHEDLRALDEDLQELERRGVEDIEDISPGAARNASISSLRNLCERWKHYFPGKYSHNQWFTEVIWLRDRVKGTLEATRSRTASNSANNDLAPAKWLRDETQGLAFPTGAAPVQGTRLQAEVERYMLQITEQVQSPIGGRASSVTAIDVYGLRLMLSTGEVDAFQEPGEGMNLMLQRAVAVRAVLLAALEKTDAIDLRAAVELAQSEVMSLQQQIAEIKEAGDLNAAVNLRACDRSLRKALEKMDKSALAPAGEGLPVTPSPQQKPSKGVERS